MTKRVRMVPCYPWPLNDTQLLTLRVAKDALDLDHLIQPRQAVPGSPGIILTFGEIPNFVCTYAIVDEDPAPDSVQNALAVILSDDQDDPRLGHPINVLQSINIHYKELFEE